MIGNITAAIAKENLNISNMVNTSKGDWAYTLIDLDSLDGKNDAIVNEIAKIDGVVNVRVVREA